MAVTGVRPSAAAWSPNEEERRKPLLAYLMEAVPAIIWDNIPRGSQISCPHIRKILHHGLLLGPPSGVSEMVAVSASSSICSPENNIASKGDLASRSLQIRLEIDRADPENRISSIPTPSGGRSQPWRGPARTLQPSSWATRRCGRDRTPPLQPGSKDLVAACRLGCRERRRTARRRILRRRQLHGGKTPAPLRRRLIDFRNLFLRQEDEDEESASLADALGALAEGWPNQETFKASDVAIELSKIEWMARQRQGEKRCHPRVFLSETAARLERIREVSWESAQAPRRRASEERR